MTQWERTEKLIADVKAWCREERGRQVELAKALGTSRQTITNWFRGEQRPTSEQTLVLLDFLKREARKR